MSRVLILFWAFLVLTIVSGGLLGRYVAAFLRGYGSLEVALFGLILAVLFAFGLTVLIRILRADGRARQALRRERR